LVVVAVWHLLHFSLAMMSSAAPARALLLRTTVAKAAAMAKQDFMATPVAVGLGKRFVVKRF
jgi:hypothetical protein